TAPATRRNAELLSPRSSLTSCDRDSGQYGSLASSTLIRVSSYGSKNDQLLPTLSPDDPLFFSQLVTGLFVVVDLDGERRRATPPDLQHLAAERELIPRAKSHRSRNPSSIDLCTVRTIKIFDGCCSRDDRNSCVMP